jgi:hypothetical protein
MGRAPFAEAAPERPYHERAVTKSHAASPDAYRGHLA